MQTSPPHAPQVHGETPGLRHRRRVDGAPGRPDRFGGTEGNEHLTQAAALVLIGLLVAEGLTILRMSGLVGAHMLIGIALIPPVLLKLGSTGYRFVRYYAGSRAYKAKGPPRLLLRLLAPFLVAATIAVLTTGLLLLADGRKSGPLLELHKVSFIAWGVFFGVHFLAYAPSVLRSLQAAWGTAARQPLPGARLRGALTATAAGSGVALALALLPAINAWHP